MTATNSSTNQNITYQYTQETHHVEEEGTALEHVATQLVQKGQQLVSLSPQEGSNSAKGPVVRLVPGEHTVLSSDGHALVADTTGFPWATETQSGSERRISVTITPLVTISEDKMFAHITLYPVADNTAELQSKSLMQLLAEEGIQHGLDEQTLDESIQQLSGRNAPLTGIIAARGSLPLHGQDAYLRYELEIGPIAGKLLKNGKIDFRERRMFVGVEQDQLIATKVPATAGIPGKNIFGEELAPHPGKDINITVSEDVSYSAESREVRATKSGILSIVNDNNIKVSAKHIISGDVDFSTGNIVSKDAVEISGTVKPGFSVITRGDIVISGNVDSAAVICQANVVIKGGLLGESASLKSRGDVDIFFNQRGAIQAEGAVILRKEAYYCTILAEGNISCDEQSKIVGSRILCGGTLRCGDVGSANADATLLGVGVSGHRYRQYQKLKKELAALEEEIALLSHRYGGEVGKQRRYKKLESQRSKAQEKLEKMNLIPHTPELSLGESQHNVVDAELIVSGTIMSGTRLRIGNVTHELTGNYSSSKFILDREQQRIIAKEL